MINIKVDKELVDYLGVNKLKVDEIFILSCFCQDKLDLLKTYLSHRNPDQCTAYLQSLQRKLLIKRLSDIDFDWDNYEVTEMGHSIYSDISAYTNSIDVPVITGVSVDDKMGELTDEFLNLFPDLKNAAGEKLRSNKTDTQKKLEQFMTKYKIRDSDLILSSTARYLKRMKNTGYQYCSCAMYFILKDGVSKLATECESSTEENPTNTWDTLA